MVSVTGAMQAVELEAAEWFHKGYGLQGAVVKA